MQYSECLLKNSYINKLIENKVHSMNTLDFLLYNLKLN